MHILTEADLPLKEPVAMALGFFDGVHLGHQALLRKLKEQPERTLAYTFDRKPSVPKPLFTSEERESLLASAGIDMCFMAPFTPAFQEQSPRAFLRQIVHRFNVRAIVVGSDFRFGKHAAGDVVYLAEQAPKYGYRLVVVKVRGDDDRKYSSSSVRHLVSEGRIEEAEALMGHAYFVDGAVVSGAHVGRTLGFPTANVHTDKVLPAFGVYATLTRTRDGLFPSVTNVGRRPTLDDGGAVSVESYLLNHNEEMYGQHIRIYFVSRIRPEIKFRSLSDLRTQIEKDSQRARALLSNSDIYTRHQLC